MSSVTYTYEDNKTYVSWDNRKTDEWNKRWVKPFDLKLTVTATITNGTYTGPTSILGNETLEATIAADDGYDLPETITVTGATLKSFDTSTGKVTLTNLTDNVVVTATCIEHQEQI